MIIRSYYMDRLKTFRDIQLVKILFVIDSCGKSTILDMLHEDLLKSGIDTDHIINLTNTSASLSFK